MIVGGGVDFGSGQNEKKNKDCLWGPQAEDPASAQKPAAAGLAQEVFFSNFKQR